MAESNDPTIPMRKPTGRKTGTPAEPGFEAPSGWSATRPFFVVSAIIVPLLIGWGAWSFLGSSSSVDEGESIADFEGFESAPSFENSSPGGQSGSPGLGEVTPMLAAPDITFSPPARRGRTDSLLGDEPTSTADVWLTGTIEDSESIERIELPERLSGGANDSVLLR